MRIKLLIVGGLVAGSLVVASCSKSSTGTKLANSNASAKSGATTSGKPGEVKVTKPGEKGPDAAKKTVPESKKVPVPENWVTYYDQAKGYEFSVPEGTLSNWQTVEDVDVFVANVPEPAKVAVMVVAFNNKNLTKADLLESAKRFLAGMGEKDIKVGSVMELNADYDLVEISSVDEKGVTTKAKLLIATDITDNYLVFVGSPEADFKANEKVIDEIWGSFGMYSGGASGSS